MVELIQIILLFESHVRGISIIVGIIIFSIGVGLDFVRSRLHRCLILLLVEISLGQLRKLRILAG